MIGTAVIEGNKLIVSKTAHPTHGGYDLSSMAAR
jgi:hypothetical protein